MPYAHRSPPYAAYVFMHARHISSTARVLPYTLDLDQDSLASPEGESMPCVTWPGSHRRGSW